MSQHTKQTNSKIIETINTLTISQRRFLKANHRHIARFITRMEVDKNSTFDRLRFWTTLPNKKTDFREFILTRRGVDLTDEDQI